MAVVVGFFVVVGLAVVAGRPDVVGLVYAGFTSMSSRSSSIEF